MVLAIRDFGMCSITPPVRYVILQRGERLVQRVAEAVVVPGKPLTSWGDLMRCIERCGSERWPNNSTGWLVMVARRFPVVQPNAEPWSAHGAAGCRIPTGRSAYQRSM